MYEEAQKKKLHIKSVDGMLRETAAGTQAKDPFDKFGHGIQSYLRMLRMHIVVFFALTLLFLPVTYIYSQGGAFDGIAAPNSFGASLTLGSLGHAGAVCVHEFTAKELPATLECRKGRISKLIHYGLMPRFPVELLGTADAGLPAYQYDWCGDRSTFPEIETCTAKYLDTARMVEEFARRCTGSSSCAFDMKDYLMPAFWSDTSKMLLDSLTGNSTNQSVSKKECDLEYSKIYAQYNCDFTEILEHQQSLGLFITTIAVIACILYRGAIYFLRT